jgi:hypothetical protein
MPPGLTPWYRFLHRVCGGRLQQSRGRVHPPQRGYDWGVVRLAKVLICVVLAAFVLVAAGTSATANPWLRAVRTAPLVLEGGGFMPNEHVRLTLRVGKARFARTTIATASGTFTAGFGLAAVDPCRGVIVVTARGSRGSTSSYRRACRPSSTTPPSRSN